MLTANDGAKRGAWQPVISNGRLDGVASASNGELHGVRLLSALYSPHVLGFATVERDPPLSCTFSSLNGSSGFSSKTVVSWPVAGSGVTVPLTLTSTPWPASVR